MYACAGSFGLDGISAFKVKVECDHSSHGLPGFDIVGLPDTSVKEAKDRVIAASKNCGVAMRLGKFIVLDIIFIKKFVHFFFLFLNLLYCQRI